VFALVVPRSSGVPREVEISRNYFVGYVIFFTPKCTEMRFSVGLRPRTHCRGGAYRTPRTLSWIYRGRGESGVKMEREEWLTGERKPEIE